MWKNEPMRARVDPKTKDDDRYEPKTTMTMNANTEQEFCTTPESQFCQALRGNNGMTAEQKLLESEQMDWRGGWSGPDYFVGPDVCGCVDGFDGPSGFDGGFDGFDGFIDGFDGT